MRIYQAIITDILSYMRYLPDTALEYEKRLQQAAIQRDQETEAMKAELE